jgi:hypothetical protein
LRHLQIMAATRASLLPATSNPNAWSSKGAHAGTSKWYHLHRRHRPARLHLAHRGVHRPDQQALHF